MRSLLGRRRTLVWGAVLLLASLGLTQVPLFNLVGFEFSLALALLATPAAAHLAAGHARTALAAGRAAGAGRVPALWAAASAVSVVVLLVPGLLVMSANALFVRNCSFLQGLAFFGLLPVVGVLAAAALGTALGLCWPGRRPGGLALALVLLTSWLGSLLRFYSGPPIFVYDVFYGYFPGSLYDEALKVGRPLLIYRAFTFLFIATLLLLAAAWRAAGRPRTLLLPAGLIVGAATVGLWLQGGELGFAGTSGSVARQLGGRHETEHFVLHFEARGPVARDLAAIAADHEFRYAQLIRGFGIERPSPEKIHSFLFTSAAQKAVLMGAENTYIAKPWRREVYLQHDTYPHRVLKHEIAHILAGEFARWPFYVSARAGGLWPVPGLIEGAAVAVTWNSDRLTVDQWARAMRDVGLAPRLRDIVGVGFLAQSGARSYTVAGSFVRYLMDRYGLPRFQQAYRTGQVAEVYGKSVDALEQEWLAQLAGVRLDHRDQGLAQERFRRPSILRRHCAHEVARLRQRAADLLARGQHPRALAEYRRIVGFEPDDPRALYDLASAQRLAGQPGPAAETLQRLLGHRKATSTLKGQAEAFLGDMAWRAGQLDQARQHYSRALGRALSDGEERLLQAKLEALQNPPLGGPLQPMLTVPERDRRQDLGRVKAAVAAAADRWLGHYLLGRQLVQARSFALAEEPLERALALGMPPLFVRETRRLQGISRLRRGRFDEAARAYRENDREGVPEGDRVAARDFVERCEAALRPGSAR